MAQTLGCGTASWLETAWLGWAQGRGSQLSGEVMGPAAHMCFVWPPSLGSSWDWPVFLNDHWWAVVTPSSHKAMEAEAGGSPASSFQGPGSRVHGTRTEPPGAPSLTVLTEALSGEPGPKAKQSAELDTSATTSLSPACSPLLPAPIGDPQGTAEEVPGPAGTKGKAVGFPARLPFPT